MKFYVRLNEKIHGPFSGEQITKLGNSGKIDKNTPLCLDANGKPDQNWLPAFAHRFTFRPQRSGNQSASARTTTAQQARSSESSSSTLTGAAAKPQPDTQQASSREQMQTSADQTVPASWYYIDSANQQNGPHSIDTMKQLLSNQVINSETLVWCEGMDQWGAVKNVDALKVKSEALPPPLPPKITAGTDRTDQANSGQSQQPVFIGLNSSEEGDMPSNSLGMDRSEKKQRLLHFKKILSEHPKAIISAVAGVSLLFVIVVLLLFVSNNRDVSTPAKAIIGHWRYEVKSVAEDKEGNQSTWSYFVHWYFAPDGSWKIVPVANGKVFLDEVEEGEYQLTNQNLINRSATLETTQSRTKKNSTREISFSQDADSMLLQKKRESGTLEYIDSKIDY